VLGIAQLNASPLLLLIEAIGTVLSKVVVALFVAVHPLAEVTVTVYVSASLTVMAGVVAPVDHE